MKMVDRFANQRSGTVDDSPQSGAGAQPVVSMPRPGKIIMASFLTAVVNVVETPTDLRIGRNCLSRGGKFGGVKKTWDADNPSR